LEISIQISVDDLCHTGRLVISIKLHGQYVMMMTKPLTPLKQEDVKLLIVHCSATRSDRDYSVENLIATGKVRFGQASYHWYIRRNGDIVPILPETVRGVHARGYNRCSIGICYEGGIDPQGKKVDTRTPAQKHAMFELLKSLHRDYPRAHILGHCELPHVAKACPCFTASSEYASLQPKDE
jgi:N-acetyl-anhydromuramyl-L-alanine amidase AmpD